MKKILLTVSVLLILTTCILLLLKKNENISLPTTESSEFDIQPFDLKMIKEVNKYYKENYMISPLSIGYALSMLKDGTDGNTKKELDNLLEDYKLPKIVNIKNKLSIANLLFIKNDYKDDISEDYINLLKKNYDAEVMFDKFDTPQKVNDWVYDKTFKMIKNALQRLDPSFVLGLANTIAIDLEWKDNFTKDDTYMGDFTKLDNTTYDVAYMSKSNDVIYIESDNAKGIIKDYAIYNTKTGKIVKEESDDTICLEYMALLPNKSVEEYIKILDNTELSKLHKSQKTANENLDIVYRLPKYTYDFDYKNLLGVLKSLGINDIFTINSNFSNLLNKDSKVKLIVDQVVHKTHIEVTEKGTKAAAATIITTKEYSAAPNQKETIVINFEKPFIYLIREKNTNNIWFFGAVYEPLKWEEK